MGDGTEIAWSDATWNPTVGCDRVSPGCDSCYAMTFAHRFSGDPGRVYAGTTKRVDGVTDWSGRVNLGDRQRLAQPLHWRKPRRIFVDSMSDLFHDEVPDGFIAMVFAVMAEAPQHTFQILTKRHGRMRAMLSSPRFEGMVRDAQCALPDWDVRLLEEMHESWPLKNVWLGVSVEDQQRADLRIPALLETPAAIRFLSCEPLLGPVNLDPWRNPGDLPNPTMPADTRIDWVICGGESGSGARPMKSEWAVDLCNSCIAGQIPFFFKQTGTVLARQWGLKSRKGDDPAEWRAFPQDFPRPLVAA